MKIPFFILILFASIDVFAQNTFTNNGDNVGIGTISPSSYGHGGTNKVLEIHNSGTDTHSQSHVILSTNSTNPNSSIGTLSWAIPSSQSFKGVGLISINTGATSSAIAPTGTMSFYTRGPLDPYWAERMRIMDNGDVGIGTNSPSAKLDVNGVIQTYNKDTPIANWDNLRIWSDGVSSYIHSNGDENGLVLKSNAANKILLMSNVGIGTTNPLATMHVNGNSRFESNLKVFASSEGWAEGIAIVKPSGWSGVRFTRNDPATGNFEGNWAIGYNANTGNDFSITNHYSNTQSDYLLHISASTRNVGIGTSQPDSKLTVKGKIHAEEVKVDLAVPGPDYVFEKTYALKPLSEVETFISENKHLPEIPSAKTMKEEGINVGEMQMNLLKKIEELTLYLIEQKKEIASLKQEVAALKK